MESSKFSRTRRPAIRSFKIWLALGLATTTVEKQVAGLPKVDRSQSEFNTQPGSFIGRSRIYIFEGAPSNSTHAFSSRASEPSQPTSQLQEPRGTNHLRKTRLMYKIIDGRRGVHVKYDCLLKKINISIKLFYLCSSLIIMDLFTNVSVVFICMIDNTEPLIIRRIFAGYTH